MYYRKSAGPRMEPWGNPALTGYSCKDFLFRANLPVTWPDEVGARRKDETDNSRNWSE